LRFVPWPAPALLVAPLVGSWSSRLGNRFFLVLGMALHTVGLAWFALVTHADTDYAALCGPLVLSGIGIACVFPTVSSEVMASVPPDRMGVAALSPPASATPARTSARRLISSVEIVELLPM
jgi:MFS family permease